MIIYFGAVSSDFHGTGHYVTIRAESLSDAKRLGRKYTRFLNHREQTQPSPASMREFGGPYADWTLESLRRVPRGLREAVDRRGLTRDLYGRSILVWDLLRDG